MVDRFNKQYKIELNLIININASGTQELEDIVEKVQLPKILITEANGKWRHLYHNFNMNILSIVLLNHENFNASFMALEELLWRRHYTKIVFLYEEKENKQMLDIFQKCWQQGHTSVIVWWHDTVFTYDPYPRIKIIQLQNNDGFESRMKGNFHKFQIKIPVFDYPPRCFSYRNRKGVQIQTGYFWKIIETFVAQHNGTLRFEFLDVWAVNTSREAAKDVIVNYGYSFIPTMIIPKDDYETSDAIHFAKNYLLTASGKEIPQNKYLLLTFNMELWLMTLAIVVILFLLTMLILSRSKPG
ncbi:uncharacterized protein LOC105262304 [Musca domestica]|uniref:Uncharacterized protein LOC105262304 n=1 Tax=Musca domestica TaxID=7370 RepID=A0ABM3V804_MUSDO|nr:uncharacterized protein LOC105262304 [Musca domestica]